MTVQRGFLNYHEDARLVSGSSSEKIIRISTVFITFFYNSEANATVEKSIWWHWKKTQEGLFIKSWTVKEGLLEEKLSNLGSEGICLVLI